MSPAKTAETIEMPFASTTLVGPRNHLLHIARLNAQYLPSWLSSNLLNEVGFVFGISKYVCDIHVVAKRFTFAISSSDEFLYLVLAHAACHSALKDR